MASGKANSQVSEIILVGNRYHPEGGKVKRISWGYQILETERSRSLSFIWQVLLSEATHWACSGNVIKVWRLEPVTGREVVADQESRKQKASGMYLLSLVLTL